MARWYAVETADENVFTSAPYVFRYEKTFAAPPATVWESLASDESLSAWSSTVGSVNWTSPRPFGIGTTREVVLAPGVARVHERFFRWDDGRGYSFTVYEASLPFFKHFAEDYGIEPTGPDGALHLDRRHRAQGRIRAALQTVGSGTEDGIRPAGHRRGALLRPHRVTATRADTVATLCRMAADIVPVRLGLTKGDLYTLWAPSWRDADDEWQAFLGRGDDLYGFESVADLAAFVRTNDDNDLTDHPAWAALKESSAHRLDPGEDRRHDLIGVPEVAAEKPTDESVATLLSALAVVQAIGSVCDLPVVSKFFNGNPVLGSLGGGAEAFEGRSGRKRWGEIEAVIGRGWDGVVDAIDEIVTIPEVDAAASEKAEAELAEPAPEVEDDEADSTDDAVIEGEVDADDEEAALTAHATDQVLGSDEDFWAHVGIDPVRLLTRGGTFYTLRCYMDDQPIFLGRNGRISVFGSERSLARYLADEHESDLSDLATFDDIKTAATDGSLQIDVTDDNVYVLRTLSDDIADGPDAVDVDQLELAVEFIRDVADYAEDTTVADALDQDQPLGRFVAHVLSPDTVGKPPAPYAKAVAQWEKVESFVESRLREE